MSTTMTTVTLADLRNQPQNRPYSRSLRVKVVAVGEQRHYKDQTGDAKTCLNVGVADSTDMAKVAIYDTTKFPRFVEGNYLLIRNVIAKPFGFVVTQQTRVCSSLPIQDIPESHLTAARDLIRPPAAAVQPLNIAVRSPPRQRVSVAGKILMEEEKHEVMVKQNPAVIKNIYLQDTSLNKCKVALWREFANTDVKPGDFVKITDVVTNTFRNETSLSTTAFTKILEKTDAPEERRNYSCEGVCEEDNTITFLLVEGDVLEVEHEIVNEALLRRHIHAEDIEKFLTAKCSPILNFEVLSKGATVIELSFPDIEDEVDINQNQLMLMMS